MRLSSAAREALRSSRSRGGLIHGEATRTGGDAIAVKELTITKRKKSGGSAGGRAGGKSAKSKRRPGGKIVKGTVQRKRPPQRAANAPVSSAPRPLRGNAKPGSGKATLMKEGAGQKILKTWRSMNKPTKAQATDYMARSGKGLKEVVQGVRANRQARNVNPTTGEMGRNRRIAAGVTQPKAPKLPMGLNPDIKPRKKAS